MSEFQIVLTALAGIAIALLALFWYEHHEERKTRTLLSQQMYAHQQENTRFLREMRRDSKIWRQRLSLAIARISEVVDTPAEEKE